MRKTNKVLIVSSYDMLKCCNVPLKPNDALWVHSFTFTAFSRRSFLHLSFLLSPLNGDSPKTLVLSVCLAFTRCRHDVESPLSNLKFYRRVVETVRERCRGLFKGWNLLLRLTETFERLKGTLCRTCAETFGCFSSCFLAHWKTGRDGEGTRLLLGAVERGRECRERKRSSVG